jgi:hypothetical protein
MSEAKETASIEQNNDGSVKPRGEKGNGRRSRTLHQQ